MPQLNFEPFSNENTKVVNLADSTVKNYTYLDEFSSLQNNENQLVKYGTDLLEHMHAIIYCNKIY